MADEFNKIDRQLKDAVIRLDHNKSKLHAIDKEILHLMVTAGGLEENLKNLKQNGIIALVLEYRKIKGEFFRANNKLDQVRRDKMVVENQIREIEKTTKFLNSILNDLIDQMGNNVIKGKFGKHDDRKD